MGPTYHRWKVIWHQNHSSFIILGILLKQWKINTWPPPFPVLLIEPQAFRQVRQMIYPWVACPRLLTKFVCVGACEYTCVCRSEDPFGYCSKHSVLLFETESLIGLDLNKWDKVLGQWAPEILLSLLPSSGITSIQQGAWSFRGFLPDTLQARKLRSHSSHSMWTVGFSSGTWWWILKFTLHAGFVYFSSSTRVRARYAKSWVPCGSSDCPWDRNEVLEGSLLGPAPGGGRGKEVTFVFCCPSFPVYQVSNVNLSGSILSPLKDCLVWMFLFTLILWEIEHHYFASILESCATVKKFSRKET